jgi:DNA-binding CsgD family transcriptional regulator
MFIKNYSHFHCLIAFPLDPLSDSSGIDQSGAKIWSASFRLDRDVSLLFPFINGERDDALVYENPVHVRFLFNGYRCFLYPDTAAVHFFESRDAAKAFIPGFIDFLNDIHSRKEEIRPNYDQIKQISVTDILKILPKTNCGECGYLTCVAFAAAMARGKAVADRCPGLSSPAREMAQFPVLDRNNTIVDAVNLPISTAGMKARIRSLQNRITELEDAIKGPGSGRNATTVAEPPAPLILNLTQREMEILELIAQGNTNNEISGRLFISPHTVKSHMINIFNKLGVNDRTRAAVVATQHGII